MSTISPNMGLIVSTVGVDSGLAWENNLNADLSILDGHDHSPGKGIAIPVAGLNINGDLPMNNNNLTLTRSVRFSSQVSPLALATDIGCLYEAGVDLYYNDGAGNQIRITQSGSVAGSSGTITGLPSGTASASYNAGTFVFQSATSTAAKIDGASFILRNATASSKGLTLSPPNAMASDYTLVLPALPISTKFVTLDSSGNLSTQSAVSGAQIASASLVGTQLANGTVTTVNLADQSVTTAKLAAANSAASSSCGSFTTTSTSYVDVTNLSVTRTVGGIRQVRIELIVDGTSGAYIGAANSSTSPTWGLKFVEDTTDIAFFSMAYPTGTTQDGPGKFNFTYIPSAGSHTYKCQVVRAAPSTTVQVNNIKLLVSEI